MLLTYTALTDLYSALNTNFKEKRYYLFITAQLPIDVCTKEAQERVVPAGFCSAVRFQGLRNGRGSFQSSDITQQDPHCYPHLRAESHGPRSKYTSSSWCWHQNFAGKVTYSFRNSKLLLSKDVFNLPSFLLLATGLPLKPHRHFLLFL